MRHGNGSARLEPGLKKGRAQPSASSIVRAGRAASDLPGLEADLPPSLRPQFATLVDGVPRHCAEWLCEVNFDGYRMEGGAQWTIVNIEPRLKVANAPWEEAAPQALVRPMNVLGFYPKS